MPVTKTAKRALRGSKKKTLVNISIKSSLESALRVAKREKGTQKIIKAISLTDRAAKKGVIHKNKAARIKKSLSKLMSKRPSAKPKKTSTRTRPSKKK